MTPPLVPQASSIVQPGNAPIARPSFPRAVLFLVWFLAIITATLVTFVLPEAFSSTARIRLQQDRTDIPGVTDAGRPPHVPYDPYFLQTELEVIQSEIVLDRVIDQLSLNKAWAEKFGGGQMLKTAETRAITQTKP